MEEYRYAAILLFVTAFPGMIFNWFIVIFSFRTKSLQNAFGRLLSSQALGEAVLLTLFALFVSPVMMLQQEEWLFLSKAVGHILLICYDICIYCHLAMSINRLIAITFPLYLDRIFSKDNTIFLILFCYSIAIFPTFYYYGIANCRIYFKLPEWHFDFTETADCAVIVWYADFWKYNIIVVFIVLIDLFTLTRVHAYNMKMRSLAIVSGSNGNERHTKELNFLKQACIQAAVFVMELITYFILPRFFTSRWVIYLLTTVSWAAVHTADGVITLYYNKELYKHIRQTVGSYAGSRFSATVGTTNASQASKGTVKN